MTELQLAAVFNTDQAVLPLAGPVSLRLEWNNITITYSGAAAAHTLLSQVLDALDAPLRGVRCLPKTCNCWTVCR